MIATVTISATGPLVRRALANDEGACGEIYDLLAPSVQRCVRALWPRSSHGEVEDAVQETFLRLFRGLERFDPERPLRPYALGIARLVSLELRRKVLAAGEVGDVLSTHTPTPERAARAERAEIVQDALAALAPEQRQALALRHANRVTMKELAECLACSVPTARSRLRAAAHRFAVELRQRGVVADGGVL